ncbi:MAG TPA: SEC-C metal-binding domain-containing protein [Phycisphaerae bacterium]|nr:SEC-C metal-binding domain-containing protein [Phycisphaerae bacterium]
MAGEEHTLRLGKTGRNEPCPCGSGKKYKKCHLGRDQERSSAALTKAREAAAEAARDEPEEPQARTRAPQAWKNDYAPKTPRGKPGAGSRQVTTPRKAGTS